MYQTFAIDYSKGSKLLLAVLTKLIYCEDPKNYFIWYPNPNKNPKSITCNIFLVWKSMKSWHINCKKLTYRNLSGDLTGQYNVTDKLLNSNFIHLSPTDDSLQIFTSNVCLFDFSKLCYTMSHVEKDKLKISIQITNKDISVNIILVVVATFCCAIHIYF